MEDDINFWHVSCHNFDIFVAFKANQVLSLESFYALALFNLKLIDFSKVYSFKTLTFLAHQTTLG